MNRITAATHAAAYRMAVADLARALRALEGGATPRPFIGAGSGRPMIEVPAPCVLTGKPWRVAVEVTNTAYQAAAVVARFPHAKGFRSALCNLIRTGA